MFLVAVEVNQLIGLTEPGHRWVLKNPSHLLARDAVLQTFALNIQDESRKPGGGKPAV